MTTTNTNCPITGLTMAERKALPSTYGIPPYNRSTVSQDIALSKQEPGYDLDFESITHELDSALDIGLENYGSGKASWILCDIVKGNNNMNKLAAVWQLYCSQVARQYDTRQVNKHWKKYTPEQQVEITAKLTAYLCYCAEYLQENFD